MNLIAKKIIHHCTSSPRLVYVLLLLITTVFIAQIPSIIIDTDPENMLDETHPARLFHNEVKTKFAMHDSIVVGVVDTQSDSGIFTSRTLKDIFEITKQIMAFDGVISADVMSISTVDNITQNDSGTIRFEWLMSKPPISEFEVMKIKQSLSRLPLLQETLVSKNGKAAAIYIPIKNKNESFRIAEKIRLATSSLSGNAKWYVTGLPVAEDQFGVEMFNQMIVAAPLAGLTIFILLLVFFRNLPLIIAPMIVAMATVLITMGALIGAGFTVHIMSSMIAIFLMPIAVVDSVHILSEFSGRYKPGNDLKETVEGVVGHLFTPMLYTSITSSIGFYSLMLTPIPPVQIFGAFVGTGILLAFLITITFIPAFLTRLSDKSLRSLQTTMHSKESSNKLLRFVKSTGRFAIKNRVSLLFVFVAVFVVSVWGVSKIQINDNPVRWFKTDHEIRVADKVLNENFAGTYDAYMVLTSTQPLLSVVEILNKELPHTLFEWVKEQSDAIIEASLHTQYQNMIIIIEDKLFTDLSGEEVNYLENTLQQLETTLSRSKAFQSPELLRYIADLQIHLNGSGLVGKSNSLADVTKLVARELRSGESKDYQIPNSPQAVAQTFLQYQSSHRPDDLSHFVTPDFQQTLVWLQLRSGDNQDMSRVVNLVDEYIEKNPLPKFIKLDWAGKAYLNVVWQENMVAGMLDSLISAFVIVFIIMVALFRSLIFGLLAMLPLTITITFIYGLIGIIGKDYDMPIAVLSALTLGLSVDFAIHFLERARETFKSTQSVKKTFDLMFEEPAIAISRNAIVIALGFTPLLFAPLVPYITVGVFLASIMAISALVTLLILPSVMILGARWVFGQSFRGE